MLVCIYRYLFLMGKNNYDEYTVRNIGLVFMKS